MMELEVYRDEVTYRLLPGATQTIRYEFANGDVSERITSGPLLWMGDYSLSDREQPAPTFAPSADGGSVMVQAYGLGTAQMLIQFYGTHSRCDLTVMLEVHEHLR